MELKRSVSLVDGLRYQGQGPMLAYLLHRISGVGIILFVGFHILASFLARQLGSDIGTFINSIYRNWLFQIFIFFCALFHAINGLRIVVLDLWPKLQEYTREAIWLEWFVFLPIFSIAVFILIRTGLSG